MSPPDPRLVAALRAAGCVFAEEEAALIQDAARPGSAREALLARRVAGEPLEQVLGWVDFDGHRLAVASGVFVPRQRSLLLVDLAETHLRRLPDGRRVVLDLCCGIGALGAALTRRLAPVPLELHAGDVDPAAVALAAANLDRLPASTRVRTHVGDLDAAMPADLRGRVDVVVANVPYVPTTAIATLPPEAREHEPIAALDGGADGLAVLRRVADLAPRWLRPGGLLLCEVAPDQVAAASAAFAAAGLEPRQHADDDRGATALSGRLTDPSPDAHRGLT